MLVGKVAHLGEGAPWIYKIMSHVYTSLAYALKQNELLLKECSPKFRDIVSRIERKQFSGNQREFAKELNFALKMALKMINSHSQVYLINETMREELKFTWQALHENSKDTLRSAYRVHHPEDSNGIAIRRQLTYILWRLLHRSPVLVVHTFPG